MAENMPPANYFNEGLAYLESGDYYAAIDSFTKALRLTLGDIAEVYLYRGESYAYLKLWDEALADFNDALRHNPYLAEVYNERGNLRRFNGDLAGAIEDQTFALQIDPLRYEAYFNRALAYEEMKEYTQAEADLSSLIQLNPGVAAAYEARGRIRTVLKDDDGAIDDYQRYLRMGGGREYDNQSEIQSEILSLRIKRFLRRLFNRK